MSYLHVILKHSSFLPTEYIIERFLYKSIKKIKKLKFYVDIVKKCIMNRDISNGAYGLMKVRLKEWNK